MYGDPEALPRFLDSRRKHKSIFGGVWEFARWSLFEPVRAFAYLFKRDGGDAPAQAADPALEKAIQTLRDLAAQAATPPHQSAPSPEMREVANCVAALAPQAQSPKSADAGAAAPTAQSRPKREEGRAKRRDRAGGSKKAPTKTTPIETADAERAEPAKRAARKRPAADDAQHAAPLATRKAANERAAKIADVALKAMRRAKWPKFDEPEPSAAAVAASRPKRAKTVEAHVAAEEKAA